MYHDAKKANKCIQFLERFCILSTTGKPIQLIPWQRQWISEFFGWYHEDGSPRYKRSGIFLSRGNGKTTFLAAIILWLCLQKDNVICCAATVEQANNLLRETKHIIEACPDLKKLFWIREHIRKIECTNGGLIKIISTKLGTGISGHQGSVVIDEASEMPRKSAEEVWGKLQDTVAKNPLSRFISITSAGWDRSLPIYQFFLHCQNVLKKPELDPSLLPVVFSADPEKIDFTKNWDDVAPEFLKANPSIGYTLSLDYFRDKWNYAKNVPQEQNAIKILNLMIFTGSAINFVPLEKWDRCFKSYTEQELYGCPSWCGYDFGVSVSFSSIIHVIEKNKQLYVVPRFFLPKANIAERCRRDNLRYDLWAQDPRNCFYLTDGDIIDPQKIYDVLKEDSKKFKIKEFRYDPSGGAVELLRQKVEKELHLTCVPFPQTLRYMAPAAIELQRRILAGEIHHNNNQVLSNHIYSTVIKKIRDTYLIERGSQVSRCDGAVALAIALSGYTANCVTQDRDYFSFG